jgi:hypothetical protein
MLFDPGCGKPHKSVGRPDVLSLLQHDQMKKEVLYETNHMLVHEAHHHLRKQKSHLLQKLQYSMMLHPKMPSSVVAADHEQNSFVAARPISFFSQISPMKSPSKH